MELAIIIAAVAAVVIGWHISKVHMSHGGIPVRKSQLRDYRSDRLRHGTRLVVYAAVLALIIFVALH
jgi:hypothetical protein